MSNSSAMCRRQEAQHRQHAAASPLQKVREIALIAARAWELEAMEAEARETGGPMLNAEDEAIALEFRLEDEEIARAEAGMAGRSTEELP